jgi:hypothetical protein
MRLKKYSILTTKKCYKNILNVLLKIFIGTLYYNVSRYCFHDSQEKSFIDFLDESRVFAEEKLFYVTKKKSSVCRLLYIKQFLQPQCWPFYLDISPFQLFGIFLSCTKGFVAEGKRNKERF